MGQRSFCAAIGAIASCVIMIGWSLLSSEREDGRWNDAVDVEVVAARMSMLESNVRLLQDKLDQAFADRAVNGISSPTMELRGEQSSVTDLADIRAELEILESEWRQWMAVEHMSPASSKEAFPDADDLELAQSRLARDSLVTYQSAFANKELDLASRLELLHLLRRFPISMNALDPVIGDLVELLMAAVEGREAERTIDAVSGIEDDRIVFPLLHILQSSNDDGVRKEAVRALRIFLDQASVVFALEGVANEDSQAGSQARAVLKFHER